MEALYIVIYRYSSTERWQPKDQGVFEDRKIAEGFRDALQFINPHAQYAIVEGPIVSPETMAEAEARLGKF